MSNKMLFLKKLHLKRMQACWCLKSREILFWTSSTKYYKVINLYNFLKKKNILKTSTLDPRYLSRNGSRMLRAVGVHASHVWNGTALAQNPQTPSRSLLNLPNPWHDVSTAETIVLCAPQGLVTRQISQIHSRQAQFLLKYFLFTIGWIWGCRSHREGDSTV